MALPAKIFWAKLQKEIKGKSNAEQIAILRRYTADWPGWDDIQYRKMREQCLKLLRKLENSEAVKSSRGHQDLFHVKRQDDGQICLAGMTNSGKSAIVSTLTSASTEVTDYPFATQVPIPGMLEHHGAVIQLVDTPAIVPGISNGEGVGRKLLHLFSVADALGIVVDLSQDPIEQITSIFTELSAAQMLTIPHPISTVLRVKSKGGIKFIGHLIAKEEQRAAQQILASGGISHAEIRVREQFSAEELSAQVEHKHPLPSIIIANKNDVPDAGSKCEALRKSFADYTIIDVNFLDETNFDTLKDELFSILGLIQLFLLDRSSRDSKRTLRIVPKASTISEVVERLSLPHADRLKAANIWGKSVKYDGQEVGIDHLIEDGDMIYLN